MTRLKLNPILGVVLVALVVTLLPARVLSLRMRMVPSLRAHALKAFLRRTTTGSDVDAAEVDRVLELISQTIGSDAHLFTNPLVSAFENVAEERAPDSHHVYAQHVHVTAAQVFERYRRKNTDGGLT